MNHECHYTTKNSHLSRGRIEKGHYDKKRKVVTIWSRIVAVCVRREARGGSPRVLERERNGLSGWPSGPQRCAPTQCLRPAAPSQLAAAAPSPQHPRRPLPGSPVESRRATGCEHLLEREASGRNSGQSFVRSTEFLLCISRILRHLSTAGGCRAGPAQLLACARVFGPEIGR